MSELRGVAEVVVGSVLLIVALVTSHSDGMPSPVGWVILIVLAVAGAWRFS